MTEDTEELLESIDNRLKWLLKLEAESHFDDEATNKEKVRMLYQMGFDNPEMAEIVNTSEASIRSTLSDLDSEGVIDR